MNLSALNPSSSLHHQPQQPLHLPKQPLKPSLLNFSSLLKPTAVTLTAAAALLLSRFPNPSPALALTNPVQTQPQSQSQSLPLPQIENLDDPIFKSHLLIHSGDTSSAKNILEGIISENPLSVDAYHGLIMACREAGESLDGVLERIENAIEMCKKEKRNEDAREFRMLKAEIKVAEGKYEEAIRVYEEVLREVPRDFKAYLCEGIVYLLMGRKEEAEKRFEKYRKLVPEGHPYKGFFQESEVAMKVLGQMVESRKAEATAG